MLGHIVCHDNLLVDPHKIRRIIVMLAPTNPTEIKWFLKIGSFNRHYFRNFASKVAPTCKWLKKDGEFLWT
jgi:hypothetical protein